MPDFPRAVPSWPDLVPMSQDDILALFDRILPEHYLAPLKEPGPGYEYLEAVAKMIARVSEAIAHVGSGCYIGSATGGQYAGVIVELSRETDTFGAVTLLGSDSAPQGTLVGTAEGYTYQLVEDVTFGASDLGPHTALAKATVRGWLYNRPGPFTTADNELVPGPIDRLIRPVVPGPGNFDPTIQVRQVGDATNGSSNMLDGLGIDRGIPRQFAGIRQIRLARQSPAAGDVVILPGTTVGTANGFHYQTTTTLTIASGDTAPYWVSVAPLFVNEPANENEITAVLEVNWGTATEDASLFVAYSPLPLTEDDVAYRTRMTQMPVTVTPNALQQVINQTIGSNYGYRETWDVRYQMAYDAVYSTTGGTDYLTSANLNVPCPSFNGAVFVYDYVQPDDETPSQMAVSQLSNRYLGDSPERGVIVLYLPDVAANATKYAGLAAVLEQVKPAGATVLYVSDLP